MVFAPLTAAVLLTAPLPVEVVVSHDEPDLVRVARDIHAGLAAEPKLRPAREVVITRPSLDRDEETLQRVRVLREEAWADYSRLNSPQVLQKTTRAEELVRPLLDRTEARTLLAQLLRIRGLTHLFNENAPSATRAFVSASFLDPEFSPAEEEWPPEARLAFADAVAKAHRAAKGALSIEVAPALAKVWLDGREIGIGPTTVKTIQPGNHFLLIRCAGFVPFAAVVNIQGGGKLQHVPVFMSERPTGQAQKDALASLLRALGGPEQATVAHQAMTVRHVAAVVIVSPPSQKATNRDTLATVRLLGESGGELGEPMMVGTTAALVAEVKRRLFGAASPVTPPPATPWYEQWYTWTAAGVAVVGGGLALYFTLGRNPDRVSFFVGPKQ